MIFSIKLFHYLWLARSSTLCCRSKILILNWTLGVSHEFPVSSLSREFIFSLFPGSNFPDRQTDRQTDRRTNGQTDRRERRSSWLDCQNTTDWWRRCGPLPVQCLANLNFQIKFDVSVKWHPFLPRSSNLTSLDAFSPSLLSSWSIFLDLSAASFSRVLTAQPIFNQMQ